MLFHGCHALHGLFWHHYYYYRIICSDKFIFRGSSGDFRLLSGCSFSYNPFMKPRTTLSMELYELMLSRGYPEEFCDAITKNLNTDFTAKRMIGYLRHMKHPSLEDVADEMLAILRTAMPS